MISTLRPWPSRSDRKAGIRAAEGEKAAAQLRAGHARRVSQSISDLVYSDNHWAAMVAESLGITHGDRNGKK